MSFKFISHLPFPLKFLSLPFQNVLESSEQSCAWKTELLNEKKGWNLKSLALD